MQKKKVCDYFKKTKYAKGILPIDTYKKDVDTIVSAKLNMDWEALRRDIVEHGLRHSNIVAQMPVNRQVLLAMQLMVLSPQEVIVYVKNKKGPIKTNSTSMKHTKSTTHYYGI